MTLWRHVPQPEPALSRKCFSPCWTSARSILILELGNADERRPCRKGLVGDCYRFVFCQCRTSHPLGTRPARVRRETDHAATTIIATIRFSLLDLRTVSSPIHRGIQLAYTLRIDSTVLDPLTQQVACMTGA